MAVTTNFSTEVVDLVNDLVSAEKVTLANAIYEKSFEISDFAQAHTVIPGIREGQVVPIISTSPDYAAFPYKDPTNCTLPSCDLNLPFSAKEWEIGMAACDTEICINGFDENFLVFFGEYKKVFGSDADVDGALMTFIRDKYEKNLQAAMWRNAYFGDRTIGSGDANYQILRTINGIFTQAEAGDGMKIEIPQNGTTAVPTGEELYNILLQAYQYASVQPWFDPATLQFEMTAALGSVLIGWYNSLGDKSPYNCECFSADGVSATRNWSLDGVTKVFGIPVIIRREFDGIIAQLGLGNRYRALLTNKDNILFGTSEMDQLPKFDMWYSRDDNDIKIRGGFSLAASLVRDEYVYIGAENANTPSS